MPVAKLSEPVLHHVNEPIAPPRYEEAFAIRRNVVIRIPRVPETGMSEQRDRRSSPKLRSGSHWNLHKRSRLDVEQLAAAAAPTRLDSAIPGNHPLPVTLGKRPYTEFVPS